MEGFELIQELIVVEGKDDISAVKRAVDADIISTNGFGITEEIIQIIDKASKTRGVIIFMDPDFAGDKIRRYIHSRVPNCKDAFLPRHLGIKNGDIGIENASAKSIREALSNVKTISNKKANFTVEDLIDLGLIGEGSKSKRRYVGEKLGIGYCNSKQFLNRINSFNIPINELYKLIREFDRSF